MYINRLYIALIMLVAMVSCKPSLPSDIMSRGEMEDVLYDMHMAHFIPEDEHDNNSRMAMDNPALQHARKLQVLRDHGISEKEWDKNITYYTRHAQLLAEVYDDLLERMSEDAQKMGISVDGSMADVDDMGNDSTNIWEDAKNMVLLSYEAQNVHTWQVTPKDSVLTKGETITLTFNALHVNDKALQQTYVQMSILLDNDSIIQTSTMINGSGKRVLNVTAPNERTIKKINGMFMMKTRAVSHQVTSSQSFEIEENKQQALLLSDIRLLHKAPTPPEPVKEDIKTSVADSTKTDTIKKPRL